MVTTTSEFVLEVHHVRKAFAGTQALKGVSFGVRPHEVLGVVGENGAGKSTLLKILAGLQAPDAGQLVLRGQPVRFHGVRDAAIHGIGMVFQEQSLLPNLRVGENIYLGAEGQFTRAGLVGWSDLYRAAAEQLARVGADINPQRYTADLSFAERQMVEIAKVLRLEAASRDGVIIFDEPTTVLEREQVSALFDRIRALKEFTSVIFVSHRLDEILELCDRIVVLRNGECVAEVNAAETSAATLRQVIIGRETQAEYYRESEQVAPEREVALSVRSLSHGQVYQDISFDLRRGEIVGLCGLEGSGKEEMCRSLFGITQPDSGTIAVRGAPVRIRRPGDAIRLHIGYVPQDRGVEGLVLFLSIKGNISLPILRRLTRFGLLRRLTENHQVDDYICRLRIKAPSRNALAASLSGGNQQKVVLAKWLAAHVDILILDHPTRGIDIGAKEEVYALMRELARRGVSILLLSDTLDEAIGMSQRVLVFKDGQITAQLDAPPGNKPPQLDVLAHMM